MATIPTLGIRNLWRGVALVLLPAAAAVTSATMWRSWREGMYVEASAGQIAAVAAIKLMHYLAGAFMALYLFVFDRRFDVTYAWFYMLVVLHWVVLGECVLSFLERWVLDPSYRIGRQPHAMINQQIGVLPMLVVRVASMATIAVVAVRSVYPANAGLAVLIILASLVLESGNAWARLITFYLGGGASAGPTP